MDKLNIFNLRVDADNPYAGLIEKFVVGEFGTSAVTRDNKTLDLLTEAVVATGQVRYGPAPSPESLVAIRAVITQCMERGQPIPVLIAWGSEKPNGTGIDVAELCALKTLLSLQRRVTAFYVPGIQVNIRVEDASAPHLFYDRMEQARNEAKLYTDGLVDLIDIMGLSFIKPVPESTQITEAEFNACADQILPLMVDHVRNPVASTVGLASLGWTKITQETVDHYMRCYENLYPEANVPNRLYRLARYFAGSLARKQFKLTGADQKWGGDYIDISFVPPAPGVDSARFLRRIYYRTMPSKITSQHMPPWRSKGYLKMGATALTAGLASFRAEQEYNLFSIKLEDTRKSVVVQADYVITA